ncbi:MAG: hypothetical protein LBU22_01350 [Dysgonamonadaceae bacterium]|jgi:hypothetical protein|nr:hypothetical protein [Dysgonamonadaceae bacterium]
MKKVSTIRKILAVTFGTIAYTIVSTGLDYFFHDELNWQQKGIINFFIGLAIVGCMVFLLFPRIVSSKEEKNSKIR